MIVPLRLSRHGLTLVALVLLVSARVSHANPPPAGAFDIPPQALETALLEYAKQSGLELIAVGDFSDIPGRFGVTGRLDPEGALRDLLEGSGLRYRFEQNGMVIVTRMPAGATTEHASSGRLGRHEPQASPPVRRLGEITVTARLHHEKLQDVPISMTAMTGEEIAALGLDSVSDVVRMTPGVSSVDYGGGFTAVQIRGISTSLGGNANGYYLDGVPFTGVTVPWYPDVRSWDIDRVEVLKGPQGTTFGEGAMGGMVRVITRRPEFNQPEAALDLSGTTVPGGGSGHGAKVMANIPLAEDMLALRLAATDETLPGWIDDPAIGREGVNENRIRTGRVKLRYKPSERFEVNLSYWTYWLRADDGYNMAPDDMASSNYSDVYAPWNAKSLVVTRDLEHSQWFYSWSAGQLRRDARGALGSGVSYDTDIGIDVKTQEMRWASTGNRTLSWTIGYYLRRASRHDHDAVGVQPASGNDQSNRGYALYAETILKLPDPRWALTTGLRWFSDRVDARSGTAQQDVVLDARFSSWNPRLGLSFSPGDDNTLLYASMARGFRSGQLQPVTSYLLADEVGIKVPVAIRPDSILTHELGAKWQFDDARLVLDMDVFHSRWKDVAVRVPLDATFNALVNSDGVRSRGAGFHATYAPNHRMTWTLGASVVDAVYVADVPGTPLRKGTQVYNVPETTLEGSFAYAQPMGSGLDFVVRGTLAYSSARKTGLTTGSPGDAMMSVSTRIGLQSGAGWRVYLFGNNLTDDRGALTARDDTGAAYRQRPRSFGLEVSWVY